MRASKCIGNGLLRLKAILLATAASLVIFSVEAGGPANPPFIINSDEASGIYSTGRDILFTVKPGEGKTPSDLEMASGKIIFNGVKEFQAEKSLTDGVMTLRVKPSQAGWYRCDISLPVPGSAPATASAGALVSPADIGPSVPEPVDFDAFWKAKKDALEAAPLKFDLTPLSEAQRKAVSDFESAGYECFAISVEVPAQGVRPVMGYFARPKNAKAGSHPAILYLRAAGVSGSWCVAYPGNAMKLAKEYGAIVLDINAHGIPNDMPKEYYEKLEKGELSNYPSIGKGNRDSFYFVGMYMRLMKSVDFLCSQKEWDGLHLITIGESQGGGQALAAAGLDSRVSAVSAIVPALCDFSDAQPKRLSGWPRPLERGSINAKEVCYCDNVFFASRSKAETQIFTGLIDTTCPAPGIFAAYNNLHMAKNITVYPHKGHNGLPKEDLWLGDMEVLQKAFIKHHIGL